MGGLPDPTAQARSGTLSVEVSAAKVEMERRANESIGQAKVLSDQVADLEAQVGRPAPPPAPPDPVAPPPPPIGRAAAGRPGAPAAGAPTPLAPR